MATVTDELITILKLSGAQDYQRQMGAAAKSLDGLATAEGGASAALLRIGANIASSVISFEALRRGINFVNDSFKLFAEDDAISRRVAFALKQVKSNVPFEEFDKLADSISRATGFDDDLIRSQVEVLARFKLTGDQIRTLLPLIVDVAAREGKSVDEVTQAVGLGLEGQARGLTRLGLKFKATGDEVKNYNLLLKELLQFQGAAAAAAESPAGLLRSEATVQENLRHAIGARFAPSVQGFIQGGQDITRAATASVEKGALGRLIDFLQSPFTEAGEAGLALRRGQTAAGRAVLGALGQKPISAAEDAARLGGGGPAGGIEQKLGEIATNTKETHKALIKGGSAAAQGVSIRDLQGAVGARR